MYYALTMYYYVLLWPSVIIVGALFYTKYFCIIYQVYTYHSQRNNKDRSVLVSVFIHQPSFIFRQKFYQQ